MPQAFYVGVVLLPLLVFLNFGRLRLIRLPWIAIPLGIALLCALISQLVWPHPPADQNYTMMRLVGIPGTVLWLVGMINALRMHVRARNLIKEVEEGLVQLEAGTIRSEVVGGRLQDQLAELAHLIAPIGIAPGSDITSAWVEARLREVETARQLSPGAGAL